jgi:transposase
MPGTTIAREIKEEVISKIKSEGITGAEASRRYGIHVKSIYRWLSEGIGGATSHILEINRIKRENQSLKQIIGQLLLDKERGKKG